MSCDGLHIDTVSKAIDLGSNSTTFGRTFLEGKVEVLTLPGNACQAFPVAGMTRRLIGRLGQLAFEATTSTPTTF
jgi:hypothetical protein